MEELIFGFLNRYSSFGSALREEKGIVDGLVHFKGLPQGIHNEMRSKSLIFR